MQPDIVGENPFRRIAPACPVFPALAAGLRRPSPVDGMLPPSQGSKRTTTQMQPHTTGKRLLAYVKPQWRMFGTALLFFTLSSAVEPVIPALFKKLIDSGFKDGLDYPLWLVPLIIIGLFLTRGVLNFAGSYSMSSAITSMVLDFRRDLMSALLRADSKLFSSISPGVAVTKVINGPQQASQTIGNTLITFIKDATTLMFLIGYLVYLNWQLR